MEEPEDRVRVLETALKILSDGEPRTGRKIAAEMRQHGVNASKRLVNSILFSEGLQHVDYDKNDYTYRIKNSDNTETDNTGVDDPDFLPLRASSVRHVRKCTVLREKHGSAAFFRTEVKGGRTSIFFNNDHPYSSRLFNLGVFDSNEEELEEELQEVMDCLQVLFEAWADLETEQPQGRRAELLQEIRIDWGRKLRDLVNNNR